jgi:hypothetical protein
MVSAIRDSLLPALGYGVGPFLWTPYLAELRGENIRKTRLLQTLAGLDGRKIIDGKA